MTPRAVNSRHALEACTLQLHAWKPFQIQPLPVDPSNSCSFRSKKPCLADRSTAPTLTADGLEFFRLSLIDDTVPSKPCLERGFRWLALRKRRRKGSRSVSGRSTCSDFPPATYGTDSSGELFLNGDGSWGPDVSEARVSRRDGVCGGEGSYFGSFPGGFDAQGNDSGYGSETGYRGDAEFGYGDDFDEEDEDGKHLFWCGRFVGDNSAFARRQKAHHRFRRKKSDLDPLVCSSPHQMMMDR